MLSIITHIQTLSCLTMLLSLVLLSQFESAFSIPVVFFPKRGGGGATKKIVVKEVLAVVLGSNSSKNTNTNTNSTNIIYPYQPPANYNITPEQKSIFRKDGVVIIRGLLQGKELKNAQKAAVRIQRHKSLSKRLLYKLLPNYSNLEFQTWRNNDAIEKVAFDSAASTICAKLMGLDDSSSSSSNTNINSNTNKIRPLRLLKDAVLGFSAGDIGCGWHVDDKVFWPCEDRNIGKRDAGINVWITLSPVTSQEGGGLAIAPKSHKVQFAKKARMAIASGPRATCELERLDPKSHDKLEHMKKVYDLQPGDAIVHDRYIFHRAEPFHDLVQGKKAGTKQRISLRYVPADATFYKNEINADNQVVERKSLCTGDLISKGGEYFPQTWPFRIPDESQMKVKTDENPFTLRKMMKLMMQK